MLWLVTQLWQSSVKSDTSDMPCLVVVMACCWTTYKAGTLFLSNWTEPLFNSDMAWLVVDRWWTIDKSNNLGMVWIAVEQWQTISEHNFSGMVWIVTDFDNSKPMADCRPIGGNQLPIFGSKADIRFTIGKLKLTHCKSSPNQLQTNTRSISNKRLTQDRL